MARWNSEASVAIRCERNSLDYFDRSFLTHFAWFCPTRSDSKHARMAFQDLLQVLRKRRTRHYYVGAGFLGLLL
jgi:hypothetical protein